MRRGAFPVTFVHFIADWTVPPWVSGSVPGCSVPFFAHPNLHHRPGVCRRHRCRCHWRACWSVTAVSSPLPPLGVTMAAAVKTFARQCGRRSSRGLLWLYVVLMLAVDVSDKDSERFKNDDCSEWPLTINALFLSLSLLQHEITWHNEGYMYSIHFIHFLLSPESSEKQTAMCFVFLNNCKCEPTRHTYIPPPCMSYFKCLPAFQPYSRPSCMEVFLMVLNDPGIC